MNIILKRRIKLIRAMLEAKKSIAGYSNKATIDLIINDIRGDKSGYFLSVSADDPSKISFSKKNSNKAEKQSEKGRTKSSLQRFIRRQMEYGSDMISDHVLDKFATMVSLLLDDCLDSKIEIIDGEKIIGLYNKTLIRSCMTGPCASYKTSLYSLNKDKVKLVIFNGEVRALLWKCDDGKIVLDRAYPAGHWGITFIRAWAKKKGYLLRDVPDSVTGSNNNTISDGNNHIITLNHDGIFPYMDTFKYATLSQNKAIISNDVKFGSVIFVNTDGSFFQKQVCQSCNTFVEANYEYWISNGQNENILYCQQCCEKRAFTCGICGSRRLNVFRYRNWNMCGTCHGLARAFTKYNKCTCYNCQDKRNSYMTIIEKEVIMENKKVNAQLSFDFDD